MPVVWATDTPSQGATYPMGAGTTTFGDGTFGDTDRFGVDLDNWHKVPKDENR